MVIDINIIANKVTKINFYFIVTSLFFYGHKGMS